MSGRIVGLDHLGVSVSDPRARLPLWADVLGLSLAGVESVPSEAVRVWFLNLDPRGESRIELLEPTDPEGSVAQSIAKRGEGLHHLCLRVEGLDAILARLAARGIEAIGGGARPGAHGTRVAFLHPKVSGGVLIELAEHPTESTLAGFAAGSFAIAYLKDPRERLFGRIESLDARGVTVTALDLESWDSWLAQRGHGQAGPIRPSLVFLPMARVEKLLADQHSPEVPSLAHEFEQRTRTPLAIGFTPSESEPRP